jgi:hypothetical protein
MSARAPVGSASKLATVPSGNSANAASVGANTVKGPSPERSSASSAAITAASSVVWSLRGSQQKRMGESPGLTEHPGGTGPVMPSLYQDWQMTHRDSYSLFGSAREMNELRIRDLITFNSEVSERLF